jgi:hypothetical protein
MDAVFTGGNMQEPVLDSEEAVRRYAEAELERTIRTRHQEFEVSLMKDSSHQRIDVVTFAEPGIRWRITRRENPVPRWYTLEARLDQAEFVIWFGYSGQSALGTEKIMRPAVHVRFEDLRFAAKYYSPELFTLGAVLERMLSLETYRLTFPLNVIGLT